MLSWWSGIFHKSIPKGCTGCIHQGNGAENGKSTIGIQTATGAWARTPARSWASACKQARPRCCCHATHMRRQWRWGSWSPHNLPQWGFICSVPKMLPVFHYPVSWFSSRRLPVQRWLPVPEIANQTSELIHIGLFELYLDCFTIHIYIHLHLI